MPSQLPLPRHDGTLPPTTQGEGVIPRIANMAPFAVSLVDFFQRFAMTPRRAELARGLLRLRRELREAGIIRGFQWIGGSYTRHEPRPRDLDVVTFHETPASWTSLDARNATFAAHPALFVKGRARSTFGCDARFVELLDPGHVARWSVYWSTIFGIDKGSFVTSPSAPRRVGFVEISLGGDRDDAPGWRLLEETAEAR
jgi:hypothetical protein